MSRSNSKATNYTRIDPNLERAAFGTLGEAGRLYNYFKGTALPSLYTGISDVRRAGLEGIQGLAERGGAAVGGVVDEFGKVMSGHYLNPETNPFLNQIIDRSVSAAGRAPTVGAVGAGRVGSGAYANALADARVGAATDLNYSNYDRERNRMMSYLGMAPMVEELAYSPYMQQMSVGQAYEGDLSAQQQEELRQYLAPYEHLARYEDSLGVSPLNRNAFNRTRGESTSIDWGAMIGGLLSPSIGGG